MNPTSLSNMGDLKPQVEVDVDVHVHTKGWTYVRAKERRMRCQDMKAERHERKEERRCV